VAPRAETALASARLTFNVRQKMKLFVFFSALLLSGCQTALVYTGEIRVTASGSREVEPALDEFYRGHGFTPAPAITGAGFAPGEWHLERAKHLVVWLGQTRKEDRIEIRIVPQPGANDAAREVAAAIRTFMSTRFPTTAFELIEKPELDLFR
jgi:hypothetical protein